MTIMAEVLPDALIQHCRKAGDPGLNPSGRQGSRALRKWRREFKAELDVVSTEPCPLHHHDPEITRAECFAVSLWTLAQSGERWAAFLLLNRWLGRTPFNVDLQQNVSIDLTKSLDPSTLARYRWLVTHEDSLTPDEAAELQHLRFRTQLTPGDGQ
jgi:hypothetical protein